MYPANGSINGNLVVPTTIRQQSFSFIFKKQELNADGSSSVFYLMFITAAQPVPKSTYRLRSRSNVLPYKILRPYLPAEGTMNKNFVDVIINAKGADKVTINKQAADKFAYDSDNNPQNGIEYPNAFKTTVSGLKPGVNKISLSSRVRLIKSATFLKSLIHLQAYRAQSSWMI